MQRDAILFSVGFLFVFAFLGKDLSAQATKPTAKVDQEQIKKLVQQLGDEDFEKREKASKKLVEIGAAALPELEKAVKSGDAEVVERAKLCAQKIKDIKAIPQLIEDLADYNAGIHDRARASLQRMEGLAVPALIQALKHKNARVRAGAARVLGSLGDRSELVVSALIEALDDPDESVRQWAVGRLGFIGAKPQIVLPKLTKILSDDKLGQELRFTAATALGNMGTQAEPAIPLLLDYVKDKKKPGLLRFGAVRALAKMGRKPGLVVPVLITTLADRDERSLWPSVAEALGKFHYDPKASVIA